MPFSYSKTISMQNWFISEQQQAQLNQHRLPFILAGEFNWCLEQLWLLIQKPSKSGIWIGHNSGFDVYQSVPLTKAKMLLGTETKQLIFNAHSGFDLDVFGISAGCVQGGGFFCLLTPPLNTWHQWQDIGFQRYLSYPYKISQVIPRYFIFFKTVLKNIQIPILEQNMPFHSTPFLQKKYTETKCHVQDKTADQALAIQYIIKTVKGRAWRPLVLTAPRGRGKTTALGFAIANLLVEKPYRIILTAPRKSALQSCFDIINESRISFIAPDKLTQITPQADVLIVDEAAGIPLFLLKQWLKKYPRIIFSSTIDGYEGGAGGFYIRFKSLLTQDYPAFSEITLDEPIRWAKQDPLESWVQQSLLLDAQPTVMEQIDLAQCQYRRINRTELVQAPKKLHQLFALFRVAHYRTTPNHLRQLLDAPDIQIYIIEYQQQWIGAAICVDEGELDMALCEQISQGKRRVKGHLSAQNQVYYQLNLSAGQWRYRRIQRIAVIPHLQNQGLASQLITWITKKAQQDKIDYLSCSFGGRARLYYFWKKNQFKAIHLSSKIETASNTQSVLMLRALDSHHQAAVNLSVAQFQTRLIQQLRDFSTLDSQFIALLLSKDTPTAIDPAVINEVRLFVEYQRSFDASKLALTAYLIAILQNTTRLKKEKRAQKMVIQLLLQNKPLEVLCLEYNYTGRKALISALKAFFLTKIR